MKNPLDFIDAYTLSEINEAEHIVKELRPPYWDSEKTKSVHVEIRSEGNVRRLLKGGWKVYRQNAVRDRYLLVNPKNANANVEKHSPVILENNKVVGMWTAVTS